jgi:hypothetical protein
MNLDHDSRQAIRQAISDRQKRRWLADERILRQSYRGVSPDSRMGKRIARNLQRRMFPLNLTRPQAIALFGISTNAPTDTILTVEGPADDYGNIIISTMSRLAPALNSRWKLLVKGGYEKLVETTDVGELDPVLDDESA